MPTSLDLRLVLALAGSAFASAEFKCGAYWDPSVAGGVCDSGSSQSPIDISTASITDADTTELKLEMHYPNGVPVTWDGHKWVIYDKQAYVMANGNKFELIQFHMHAPSEHTINGVHTAAEVHFVHQNPITGQLLVVGVMFSGGEDVAESSFLDQLAYSAHETHGHTRYYVELAANPIKTAIESKGYYTYSGSLTTAPCSENLIWVVSKHVESASSAQVCDFQATKHLFEHTRPPQPLNGRVVKSSEWYKQDQP